MLSGIPLYLFLHKTPTCFDGKTNGEERGVDCGGSCLLLCPFEVTEPFVLWSRAFKVTEGVYSAVAYIEHANSNAVVMDAPYVFKVFDNANVLITEREGTAYILPNIVTPIFEANISTGERIPTRTTFEFTRDLSWEQSSISGSPYVVRNQKLSRLESVPRIDATVLNQSLVDLFDLEVVGVVFDVNDNAIAASQTIIPLIEKQSSKEIVFTWPEPFTTRVERCVAPVNVMLLVDTSGSMNDDNMDPPQPLTDAKNAAADFVGRLTKNDNIGLVSFATNAAILQEITDDHIQARDTVSNIVILPEEETGSTNIGDGIQKAVEAFSRFSTQMLGEDIHSDRKIIILLTDGLANEPEDPGGEPYAVSFANTAKDSGMSLFTIGLGDNVNKVFLAELASSPSQYFQAATSRDLDGIYRKISEDICEKGPAIIDVLPKTKDVLRMGFE